MGGWRHPVQCASPYQSPTGNRVLMAMESSTGISTKKTQLFKHYYLLWLHANLMRQWDFQWRNSHSFAFVHKRLIQEGVKWTPRRGGGRQVCLLYKWCLLFIFKNYWPSILFSSFCYMGIILYQLYTFIFSNGDINQNHRMSWLGRDLQGSPSPAPEAAQDHSKNATMCLRAWSKPFLNCVGLVLWPLPREVCSRAQNLSGWRTFSCYST